MTLCCRCGHDWLAHPLDPLFESPCRVCTCQEFTEAVVDEAAEADFQRFLHPMAGSEE